jgi:hypothetical protein
MLNPSEEITRIWETYQRSLEEFGKSVAKSIQNYIAGNYAMDDIHQTVSVKIPATTEIENGEPCAPKGYWVIHEIRRGNDKSTNSMQFYALREDSIEDIAKRCAEHTDSIWRNNAW